MLKKWSIIVGVLCVTFMIGTTGCAKKHIRHLASDVCLITPEVSTKAQVLTYLGPPDEQYEMKDGSETWIYYEVRRSILNKTPYIGDKLGDKKYETIKVTIAGDVVRSCVYRSLSEEEFQKDRLTE
jgi:hypothetical protein